MNVAFAVVFGIFVVLMLVLVVSATRWAVRRDRAARSERASGSATEADLATRHGNRPGA
ncbi:MAG TPA: hypothetical protein VEJ87_06870 [Acidimicrobiales bacterium]|nr:hypothetical protein [Acidimicrobiales bacterium]